MKMMKKITGKCTAAALVLCIAFIYTGCGSGESEAYETVADEFAQIILEADGYSAAYEAALEEIGSCADGSADADAVATVRADIAAVISDMTQSYDSFETYEVTDEFASMLEETGTDQTEFEYYALERLNDLYEYIYDLQIMDSYLALIQEDGSSSVVYDDFVFMYEMNVSIQQYNNEYHYLTINYWFAAWDDEYVEYVQEKIYANLVSFTSSETSWEDDADDVETRINAVLDMYSELVSELSEYTGESQERLYEMYSQLYGE